ncbi:MAG: SRPBCC domain-containing protein [Leucobacter sp.]
MNLNPNHDLTLQRVIHAPSDTVWRSWTDPQLLAKWWTPAPTVSRVDRLDVRPGGAFGTQMSEDGVNFFRTRMTYFSS